MKKIKYIVPIVLALALLGTSCSKDWLEIDPVGRSLASTYYSDEEQIGLGLMASYDFLHTDHFADWSSPFMIKLLPSDDSNCGGGGAGDQAPYQAIDDYDWSPLNDRITTFWRVNYFGILRASNVINHNATGEEVTDLVNRYVAEAKCLRAYFYLDLVMCFGDVPIQPEEDVATTTPLPRADKAEVYALIEQDLNDAIAGLPDKSTYTGADLFRVSKQTAQGLLVRAHIFQEDWAAATSAFAALEAVEGSQVGLEADFGDVFKLQGEFGIESLLEASFASQNRAWNGWGQGWARDGQDTDNRHMQLWNPRGDQGFDPGTSGLRSGWGFMPPTNKIEAAFEAGDLRKPHSVLLNTDFVAMYGGSVPGNSFWDREDCIRMKYGNYASETIDPGTGAAEMEIATNWRLLRYADVLLYAAEAYQRSGNDAQALAQLNKVRTRAGLAASTASGASLLQAIKDERFVELCFEGQRYWDLVRWNEHTTQTGAADRNALFPIPQYEIDNNAGISAANQNTGY